MKPFCLENESDKIRFIADFCQKGSGECNFLQRMFNVRSIPKCFETLKIDNEMISKWIRESYQADTIVDNLIQKLDKTDLDVAVECVREFFENQPSGNVRAIAKLYHEFIDSSPDRRCLPKIYTCLSQYNG
ncbi:DgyrCDS14838 [Dimorphilus gyrociliatus]|uniref:DgyrCDS14838 n=1 Tax=Dimorphilus gyrociliatus TaxID=2664684 RepID=A0A7I8WF17_9ANNE|nr:DgyrCDS14838 [Dimorphilus gyrociliatus]